MSMRDYGFSDYGLVITKSAAYELARQIFKPDEMADWNQEKYGWYADIAEEFNLEYVFEFSGAAFRFNAAGVESECEYEYWDDIILYAPLAKLPSLVRATYQSMDEVVSEFKDGIGKYLPEDYDYLGNICHITGTYYG